MREKYLNFILQLLRKVAQNPWEKVAVTKKGLVIYILHL